ncbi:MAG: heat-inducible transcriptional repressor HrcA [Candidatus Aminicenantes bacterium]|nr:heat-inducible transcriptional repressor HrcA [Candidatus Aminicenantes bacterium]
MKNPVLREKDKIVLNVLVEHYLKIGKPISSGFICQKKVLSDSPATIRNVMFKLEELGFLSQPHASAGRIPTDKGLRFYVNSLLEEEPLSLDQMSLRTQDLSIKKGDLNSLLYQTSRLLADQSDSLGFVLLPRISKIHFHHVRFIRIAENKVMIILITSFNLVLTEILSPEPLFTQAELDRASQYINENFHGKNLLFVRDYLLGDLPKYKFKFEQAFTKLMALLKDSIIQEEQENPIFLQGTARLIDKFDVFNLEKMKSLFQNFEEKANLAKLLSDFISLDRVKVLIGAESNLPIISDCSLILSHYGDKSQVLGSLGIIGPKRIPYKKIIPLVDSVAKKLSQTISQNQ